MFAAAKEGKGKEGRKEGRNEGGIAGLAAGGANRERPPNKMLFLLPPTKVARTANSARSAFRIAPRGVNTAQLALSLGLSDRPTDRPRSAPLQFPTSILSSVIPREGEKRERPPILSLTEGGGEGARERGRGVLRLGKHGIWHNCTSLPFPPSLSLPQIEMLRSAGVEWSQWTREKEEGREQREEEEE